MRTLFSSFVLPVHLLGWRSSSRSTYIHSWRAFGNYPPPGTPSHPSDTSGGDTEQGALRPEDVAERHTQEPRWRRPDAGADVLGGSLFEGTSRAAHRHTERQPPPVIPGSGSSSVFPGAHVIDPLSSGVRSGVEALQEQAAKAGHVLQEGTEHAKGELGHALERGEEAVDRGVDAIEGTAHDIKEGTAQAAHEAAERASYTTQEAQDLYKKAARSAEEAAARASQSRKFEAAEATLKDPLHQRDEMEAGNTARKGAARRPSMGYDPK